MRKTKRQFALNLECLDERVLLSSVTGSDTVSDSDSAPVISDYNQNIPTDFQNGGSKPGADHPEAGWLNWRLWKNILFPPVRPPDPGAPPPAQPPAQPPPGALPVQPPPPVIH